MNDIYLNSSPTGRPISAEEFAASCGAAQSLSMDCPPFCPCQQDGGCPAPTPIVCWCQPAAPRPQPIQVDEDCDCCRASMRAALQLLCDGYYTDLLDFDAAAFITDAFVAGATPTCSATGCAPDDNLACLSGSFLRFSPCNCDLLDISACVNCSTGTATGVTATQVSLCQLSAIAIQAPAPACESEDKAAQNFRCLKQRLAQRLTPCGDKCGECSCRCSCEGCCCTAGVMSVLSDSNLSRRVTLTAGLLVLKSVTLLGTVGNVLVLANDKDRRIYFVCANKVQFLG